MTVCVGVAVNDCLVFAADSASTLLSIDQATGASSILNVYRHGDKVFNLYKGLPVCGMTCGMGNVGAASIASLVKRLRVRLMSGDPDWHVDPSKYSIEEIAIKARKYLFEECYGALDPRPPNPHSLEFWVGGYSSDQEAGHQVWKVSIVNGSCAAPECQVAAGATGLFVGGQVGAIERLIGGFDPRLADVLVENGVNAIEAQAAAAILRRRLEATVVMPTMPIRDAIDLADFLVETTTRYFRFLPGADIVGGDTDIAAITRFEGFKWIRRKYFYPANLNPLETDHAK